MPAHLPLAGISVLDLAAPVSAYCARMMAGYGADVLRVEPPAGRRPSADDPRRAWLDAWYRGGCRTITLDVHDERAVPLLTELASAVDVVVASPTAATPVVGYVENPAGLTWCPPSVITCFVTPFGVTGPLRNWRATPLTSHAMSGLMYPVGPEAGPPLSMPGRQLWDEAGIRAATCIVAALHERPRVGGQVLDVAAHEVATSQDDMIHRFDVAGLVMGRDINAAPPPSGTWSVRDGEVNIAVNTPAHWASFVETLGSPDALVDERWQDRAVRLEHDEVLVGVIAPLLVDRERDEFVAHAQSKGLPCSALNTPEQFVDDQRRDDRHPLGTLTHPQLGSCDAPGAPIHVDSEFYDQDPVAPVIGAHTEAVIVDELGHTPDELDRWREQGLV